MSAAPSYRVAAVDLGASSGRVMTGLVSADQLTLREEHRFANAPVTRGGALRWDVDVLGRQVFTGIRAVAAGGVLHGIGIDSWAVDYGLLNEAGDLLAPPYAYRDPRTDGIAEQVTDAVGAATLYEVTGLQQLPFNTIYQLVASLGTADLAAARTMLLLPDLFNYWLTGQLGAERTNASTTGFYDARSRQWAYQLLSAVSIPHHLLPPLRDAATVIGPVRADTTAEHRVPTGVPVIAVGSHDTASAVVAVPARHADFAYISSGTWSLLGLELDQPVLSEAARRANFTNEAGVDGTIRFLKNVMGLWVLTEAQRRWRDEHRTGTDLHTLLAGAADAAPLRTVIDIDDPRLLPPGDMPGRLALLAREADEPVPRTPVEFTRCVLDSLALAYRRQLHAAVTIAGKQVSVVHVVGGGARNTLLCQLTADACELPVLAGPVEASALGNVLVQARALGGVLPDLASMRDLVARTHRVREYLPRRAADWASAETRVGPAARR